MKAIVGLARDFGQDPIAKGVEDEAVVEVLRDLGITLPGLPARTARLARDEALETELAPAA